ncbi:MAG: hypothetical protein UY26_C0003G0133 [Candidatus Jorgensenbacteria bacterium GW2011_GWA1_48_13]|uniref:Prepilin-type N-terminal cleavage/methylation domain-containing protein n=2 Tax=Candidatus Joergenseniibacteriota TaxID=1752739 RepID=A0A0G1W908_9BACT|nr:MAG: hypothetical protein UY26_C0003G0133 [Candidatus Jorgensenbacteria bacterium GW2011_GWA1_48_13]KKU99013.1 MAG: hypothetical protein UY32_C0008G0004 [Candidatus Jorgensenbacteria bacterium GW2011_GWC1_48_8]KKW15090.1 MAG: hypothetical protein UY55_C0002G0148 [Candidatus Jorgensenbacteria bacterium GW2011_GWB1_50_10]
MRLTSKLKARAGFTLLEVLIYSVILAIFLGAAFAFIASILGTTDNLLERNELLANAEFVGGKLNWLTGIATDVVIPAADATSTELKMNLSDASSSPAVFFLNGPAVNLSLANASSVPITSERIKVTGFNVQHISASSSPPQLRIYLSLESNIYPNIVATTTLFYVLPR